MSSPQMIKMFGLSVFAMSCSPRAGVPDLPCFNPRTTAGSQAEHHNGACRPWHPVGYHDRSWATSIARPNACHSRTRKTRLEDSFPTSLKKVTMKKIQGLGAALAAAAMMLSAPAFLRGQDLPPVSQAQQFFEAGQFDQALKAIADMRTKGTAGLSETFLAAQILMKQGQNDRAKDEFGKLASMDDPVLRLVGESSKAALEDDRDKSLELAMKAVDQAKSAEGDEAAKKAREFYAQYQLGLIKSKKEDWAGAAEAFT